MNLRVYGAVSALAVSLVSAMAQSVSIGPFYGYRFGGEFEDPASGENLRIKDNPSIGVYLDVEVDDSGLKFEFLYSYQDTSVDLSSITPFGENDLDIHVFQFGGVQELYDGRFRPYVAGYVGASYFDMPGVGSDLRFSFTVAGGANYYLTPRLGLRLDVRGIGTVVESNGGFVCANGGCVVAYSGDVLWQGEATGSVFFTF